MNIVIGLNQSKTQFDLYVVVFVTAIAALLGLVPALIALKRSLSDGLTIRV